MSTCYDRGAFRDISYDKCIIPYILYRIVSTVVSHVNHIIIYINIIL